MTRKTPSKKRVSRKKANGSAPNLKGQFLTWGLKLLLGGLALAIVFVLLVYMGLFGKIPDNEAIHNIRNHTASVVYSADGAMVGKYFIQNRLTIDNDNISIHLKNALIATEDSRFFEHKGLDFVSLGRVGGGSTISQQLAKNLYPRRKFGLLSFPVNKIREIFIAARLEKHFTKEEILGLYLNTVPFGEDIYGIEVAANRFFGKPSSRLNPSEAATLVGMLAANTAYNPRRNPERSMQRRNVVLDRMQANGFLSEEETDNFKKAPIKTTYTRLDNNHGPAPWFMEQVRMQTESILKQLPEQKHNIYTDGLRIYTTIDSRLQAYAVAATKNHLAYLQNTFEEHWKNQDPWQHNPEIFYSALRKTDRYQLLKEKGLDEKAIMDELNKTAPSTIYTHEGEKQLTISPVDSLKRALRILHTGFVAMDPSTGHVLSWVGGVDFKYFKYDHVTTRRQVGSTFKPIVYATALNQGYDPCEYISNEQQIYERFDNWEPTNADGHHDGYYSMKGGLIHSVNTIAAQVIDKTGVNSVISTARAMGISSPIPTVPSIALGTADISLLEMVTAYTAFANYGRAKQPVLILKIEDAQGQVLYEAEPSGFLE
ncbi:MAG: transglycosylase domain-containing protein, partial [Bacteroidales bacterium]|nr:transglycosylase domain-containing protein [Bacteroidales bacterium]